MKKTVLPLAIILVFALKDLEAANTTSDASLTMGKPATGATVGNRQTNPIIWQKGDCVFKPLWQISPNPWGVNTGAQGGITMQYTGNGSITTDVNLSSLVYTPVNAYPHIFYGADPFGYKMDGQPLKFPFQLKTAKSMMVEVNYALSITGKAPLNLNVAFDQWLIPSAGYTSGQGGAVEIIVAPYFAWQWGAAGYFSGTLSVPVALNGQNTTMVFNEYSNGTGAGRLITYYPRDIQISSGSLRFNMMDFMNAGALRSGVGKDWFLAGVHFGTEFGNTTVAQYKLTTTKLSIDQEFLQ